MKSFKDTQDLILVYTEPNCLEAFLKLGFRSLTRLKASDTGASSPMKNA